MDHQEGGGGCSLGTYFHCRCARSRKSREQRNSELSIDTPFDAVCDHIFESSPSSWGKKVLFDACPRTSDRVCIAGFLQRILFDLPRSDFPLRGPLRGSPHHHSGLQILRYKKYESAVALRDASSSLRYAYCGGNQRGGTLQQGVNQETGLKRPPEISLLPPVNFLPLRTIK